jgi:hypothetical protein
MWRKISEQNAGECHSIDIDHKFFEMLANFKYFGMALRNNNTGS